MSWKVPPDKIGWTVDYKTIDFIVYRRVFDLAVVIISLEYNNYDSDGYWEVDKVICLRKGLRSLPQFSCPFIWADTTFGG